MSTVSDCVTEHDADSAASVCFPEQAAFNGSPGHSGFPWIDLSITDSGPLRLPGSPLADGIADVHSVPEDASWLLQPEIIRSAIFKN